MIKKIPFLLILIFVLTQISFVQKYNYAAQKKLIPAELGRVYLGMPLRDFVKIFDLKGNRADIRFDEIRLEIPVNKGNIEFISIKAAGATSDEKEAMVKPIIVKTVDGFDDELLTIIPAKIPAKAFVYEIYIRYKTEFNLKDFAIKTYGKKYSLDSDQKNPLYAMQWATKTADGLLWLIRTYDGESGNGLMLAGRIKNTDWAIETEEN